MSGTRRVLNSVRRKPVRTAVVAAISVIVVVLSWVAVDREIQRSRIVGVWRATHYDPNSPLPDRPGVRFLLGNDPGFIETVALQLGPPSSNPQLVFSRGGRLDTNSALGGLTVGAVNLEWEIDDGQILVTQRQKIPWGHRALDTARRWIGYAPQYPKSITLRPPFGTIQMRHENGVVVIECVTGIEEGRRVLFTRVGDDNSALDEVDFIERLPAPR